MKKITRTRTTYRCGVCEAEYGKKREAEACEAGGIEEKDFRVGDRVTAREKRTCPGGHAYVCNGRIRRIVGPEPYDAEIHGKGFGLWRPAARHVYMYEIVACCTRCSSRTPVRYPAISLKKLPARAKAR